MDAAQIAAAVQAAVQQVMQAPPAGPFAVSPALAHANVIDYSTAAGSKIFTKATEELPTKFALKNPNIRVLLNELQTRSDTFGWANVLDVDVGPAGQPDMRSLLTDHGRVSIQESSDFSGTYINTQTRQAQNNYQLYICLELTITHLTL